GVLAAACRGGRSGRCQEAVRAGAVTSDSTDVAPRGDAGPAAGSLRAGEPWTSIEHVFGAVVTGEVEPVDRAVDELAGLDPDSLDDLTLTDTVVELRRVRARLDAVQARLLHALDRRRPWAQDGYRSTAAWLA